MLFSPMVKNDSRLQAQTFYEKKVTNYQTLQRNKNQEAFVDQRVKSIPILSS